jgi:hypothetical protein
VSEANGQLKQPSIMDVPGIRDAVRRSVLGRAKPSAISPPKSPAVEKTADDHEGIVTRRLSTYAPESVRWLWRNRFPLGKLSIVQGDPGKGKTWTVLYVVAQVTTGRRFCDSSPCSRADALFVTAEDGIADTIRPRVDLLKGDVNRVHVLEMVRTDGNETFLDLGLHLDLLDKWLDSHKQVQVMVLDPLAAFLGDIDSHRNNEVRAVLGRLGRMAEKHNVAVIGIQHLAKAMAKAIHRSIGSIAFVAAARAVWQVMPDADDDDRRLLLPVKMNLAKTGGLAFRLTDKGIHWETGSVEMSADDAEPQEGESPREEAREWIKAQLADGPVAAAEVKSRAQRDGIAKNTLERAKKELRVISTQTAEGWSWAMPESLHT